MLCSGSRPSLTSEPIYNGYIPLLCVHSIKLKLPGRFYTHIIQRGFPRNDCVAYKIHLPGFALNTNKKINQSVENSPQCFRVFCLVVLETCGWFNVFPSQWPTQYAHNDQKCKKRRWFKIEHFQIMYTPRFYQQSFHNVERSWINKKRSQERFQNK